MNQFFQESLIVCTQEGAKKASHILLTGLASVLPENSIVCRFEVEDSNAAVGIPLQFSCPEYSSFCAFAFLESEL